MYVPYALERVERSQDLNIDELRSFRKTSTDFFSFIRRQCCEEHIAFLASHRKDPYFGIYIEKMLSPKGLEWLHRNFQLMKQVAEEED